MGMRLMMFLAVAGSLAAMAFMAPCPSALGANVAPSLRCGSQPCDYTLSSGAFSLQLGQALIACEGARGRGQFTTPTSSRLRLTLRTCKEQNTPFEFTCVSSRDLSPRIRSNNLSAHLMEEGAAKLQLEPLRLSVLCGGRRSILEGFFEAGIEPRHCDRWEKAYALRTELIAHGGEGPQNLYDVLVDGNAYGHWQFDAPWILSFPERASIRC